MKFTMEVELDHRDVLDNIDTNVIAEYYDSDDLLESIGKEVILAYCEYHGWLEN